jgi:serine/threonine protein kinase
MTPLTFSPSADIYALGATMYKILTGQTPPESSALLNNPSLLTFQNDVPEHLVSLIKKCMRPIVGERPQSIDEFSSLLGTPQSPQPPTPPIPPTPPSPPDDSTTVITEEEFVAQYHRFVGTQKYKDAFELCLFNAKSLPAARKQLPEAAETYAKKCGGTVSLPAPSGASYDWLTDLLLSNGYKKISALKNGLQVENVSIELVQSGGQNFVRLSRKMTFDRLFTNIAAFFAVNFFLSLSIKAIDNMSYSYYDLGESIPKYHQCMCATPYEPDPTWLLLAFGAWVIIVLGLWNMWRRFRKPFKNIRKILTDDIVNKFTK